MKRNFGSLVAFLILISGLAVMNFGVYSNSGAPVTAPAQSIINEKEALLGEPVRHIFHGEQVTTILSHYDIETDTYNGHVLFPESIKARKLLPVGKGSNIDSEENIALVLAVNGLRPYPYTARPDYAFQFVRPGESMEPLLEIARRNAGQ